MPLHRVSVQPEIVDLSSLRSVRELCSKLLQCTPRLDALVLNAGTVGVTTVNWLLAMRSSVTDMVTAFTWPTFLTAEVGALTPRQTRASRQNGGKQGTDEPPLGAVFCANVFGHYLLSHGLIPLLAAAHDGPSAHAGRIIWISSLEAYASAFSASDLQGIRAHSAYDSSKRLTDVLVLGSSLASTTPLTSAYFGPRPDVVPEKIARQVKMYVAHPGICSTSIVPMHPLLGYARTAAFYITRWLGSPWHTITSYSGATAPVWLTLASQATLDQLEASSSGGGPSKWGSATDVWGREKVLRTEVEGWGYTGVIGEDLTAHHHHRPGKGRWPFATDLTPDARHAFEELARSCWADMESLRRQWDEILDADER